MTQWTRHLISLERFFEAIHSLLSATLFGSIITKIHGNSKMGKKKKSLLANGYFIIWPINTFPAVCESNMEMRKDD